MVKITFCPNCRDVIYNIEHEEHDDLFRCRKCKEVWVIHQRYQHD